MIIKILLWYYILKSSITKVQNILRLISECSIADKIIKLRVNWGSFHVWQWRCAPVCLEVLRQWIHDPTVSGSTWTPGSACLNFNTPPLLKLQGENSNMSVSQGAAPKVGERPAATVRPGERDHLLVITDTGASAKVEHAKRQNNKLKADRRSPGEEPEQRAGSEWI